MVYEEVNHEHESRQLGSIDWLCGVAAGFFYVLHEDHDPVAMRGDGQQHRVFNLWVPGGAVSRFRAAHRAAALKSAAALSDTQTPQESPPRFHRRLLDRVDAPRHAAREV